MYAYVIVNVSSSAVDQIFEYFVPLNMAPFISVGARVKVSFGNANRTVMGYVLALEEEKHFNGEVKEILELLDLVPVLTEFQLRLAYFMKKDCISLLSRVLNLMIPDAMKLKTSRYVEVINRMGLDARLITKNLFLSKDLILYSDISKEYVSLVKKEVEKGNLKFSYEAKDWNKEKTITKYIVDERVKESLSKSLTLRKLAFLEEYKNSAYYNNATRVELTSIFNVSDYLILSLVKNGVLKKKEEKVSRIKDRQISLEESISVLSTNSIKEAHVLNENLKDIKKPYLYIPKSKEELDQILLLQFEEILKENKKLILLVPNIVLAYKYYSYFSRFDKVRTLCIHSALSVGELLDIYKEIQNDEYQVIVTTPKGIFYPYQNVGCYIMIDEESDNYYNDQSPRYDLHRVVHYMSYKQKARFIMTSYNPSVNTYFHALKGDYTILDESTKQQVENIEVINMLDELRSGNATNLSKKLKNALLEVKAKGKQSLLIVNNKNYATYITCRSCGTTPKCPYCDITLNYNDRKNELICPQCGHHHAFLQKCESCGSDSLLFGGVGMQMFAKTLKTELPNYYAVMLDSHDYDSYSSIMGLFEDKYIDCIITSKTLAQGIPTDEIGLVGIINYDATVKSPAYDASSKAYELLSFSNRIKNASNGKLMVQTTNIEEKTLTTFISGNYHDFIDNEIKTRKIMRNEPYYQVHRLIIQAKYEEMFICANSIKNAIKNYREEKQSEIFIIGPTYSKKYRGVVLILKHNDKDIDKLYQSIYDTYRGTDKLIIFDKYPRQL